VEEAPLRLAPKAGLFREGTEVKRRAIADSGLGRDGGRRGRPTVDAAAELPDIFARIRRLGTAFHAHEIADFMEVIDRAFHDLSRAGIAWIDLIHVLVTHSEQRYRGSGQGELKKQEVKTVILYLVRADRYDIPHVPRYLEPLVVDVFADVAVDSVVAFLNANSHRDPHWPPPDTRLTISGVWRSVRRVVGRILGRLLMPFGVVASRIYFALRFPVPLSPALKSALDAVNERSATTQHEGLLERVEWIGTWIGHNRDALVALFELASIVADQVEALHWMSGEEKKEYARSFVYALLDELHFDYSSRAVGFKLDAGINFALDASVHLFHQRGLFKRRATHDPLSYPP
jgi:hypothetical protein